MFNEPTYITPIEFLKLVQEEYPGAVRTHTYCDQINSKLRVGQAFMNALRGTPYYDELRGSMYDPFYSSHEVDVHRAIDYLFSRSSYEASQA